MNEPINGIYDDDDNKINPNFLPVPGLCITCKSYDAADWEENVLCALNRHDQRHDTGFKCEAYEKK